MGHKRAHNREANQVLKRAGNRVPIGLLTGRLIWFLIACLRGQLIGLLLGRLIRFLIDG